MYMLSPQALCTVGPQAWGRGSRVGGDPRETLPLSFPPPQPLSLNPVSLFLPQGPSGTRNTHQQLGEMGQSRFRDRPRDMSTASEGAERADTQGYHGYAFTQGSSPGWRLREGQSCVGG